MGCERSVSAGCSVVERAITHEAGWALLGLDRKAKALGYPVDRDDVGHVAHDVDAHRLGSEMADASLLDEVLDLARDKGMDLALESRYVTGRSRGRAIGKWRCSLRRVEGLEHPVRGRVVSSLGVEALSSSIQQVITRIGKDVVDRS